MIVLYVLFALSIFFPIYTYILYPCILSIMRGKEYKVEDIKPCVSVIVVGPNAEDKIDSIYHCNYPELEVISGTYCNAKQAKGDIIVFTDTETRLDLAAIQKIVVYFADERIGCVVGQQTNPEGNSVFWKYENLVKQYESRIGSVSGANNSLFAVRKIDMPEVKEDVLNKPFYIATIIEENGKDVVFRDTARAYESKSVGANFKKHVVDAAGYWQSLKLFPKMLFGNKVSFVYVSHRVMKLFVWLNMVTMLVTAGVLGRMGSTLMAVLFWLQIAGYVIVLTLGRFMIGGALGKLLGIGYYFVMLNLAHFAGLFYRGDN